MPLSVGVPVSGSLSGGWGREGARSELASGAATGPRGARSAPPNPANVLGLDTIEELTYDLVRNWSDHQSFGPSRAAPGGRHTIGAPTANGSASLPQTRS